MNCSTRCIAVSVLSTLMVFASSTALDAQAAPMGPTRVVSANPFGLLLDIFNVEYEQVASESSTLGLGGSSIISSNRRYLNLDAFWRFYPSAVPDPLNGWAFGIKAGITHVDSNTYLGAGFDVNRSWLMGKNRNFYVGAGLGLKRIFGSEAGQLQYVPTVRIINVGYAF